MEQSQRRTEAFAPIRERVAANVAHRLDDKGALQLALACTMREPEDVVGFLFPALVAKQVLKNPKTFALHHEEWMTLFGNNAAPVRDTGGLAKIVQSHEFAPGSTTMSSALRCTVAEPQQARLWARPWSQALCYLALHLEEPDAMVESVLGTVVKADSRRLEELHGSIDDNGYETLLMAKVMIALSECVL